MRADNFDAQQNKNDKDIVVVEAKDYQNIRGQTKHVLMDNIFVCVKKGLSQNER